jgi:hypothetical protein
LAQETLGSTPQMNGARKSTIALGNANSFKTAHNCCKFCVERSIFGESWFPLSDERGGQTVEYIACAARRPFGADSAPGFAVRSHGKIGYVMLDVFDSSSAKFEQGRNAGREEERTRVIKTFHEEVSPSMIAALFLIETAKSDLEEAGLPQAAARIFILNKY